MNDRIKELEKLSGLEIYGLGKNRDKWEFTVEKFSELLIKECCDVLNKNSVGDRRVDIILAKHFDVKITFWE